MKRFIPVAMILAAGPALAAEGKPFFSLANTDFIVTISFLGFVGILLYFGVPKIVGDMLDKRAAQIQSDLDEARALREEAQTVLASYERKQEEVKGQAERIVAHAREEATAAAEIAKKDLERSIERRLKAAEDQIASAETSAIREVRDRAAQIAVAAAGDVIAKAMTDAEAAKLIDGSIAQVDAKLH